MKRSPTTTTPEIAAQEKSTGNPQSKFDRVADRVATAFRTYAAYFDGAIAAFRRAVALGLAAGKVGVFAKLERYWPLAERALPWALLLGVGGNVLFATLGGLYAVLVQALVRHPEAISTRRLVACSAAVTLVFVYATLQNVWSRPDGIAIRPGSACRASRSTRGWST